MSCRAYDPPCPYSGVLRSGVPQLVNGVLDLTTATLNGGVLLVRRVVEEVIWREPVHHHGHRCCRPNVHHHYLYSSVPRSGCGCH